LIKPSNSDQSQLLWASSDIRRHFVVVCVCVCVCVGGQWLDRACVLLLACSSRGSRKASCSSPPSLYMRAGHPPTCAIVASSAAAASCTARTCHSTPPLPTTVVLPSSPSMTQPELLGAVLPRSGALPAPAPEPACRGRRSASWAAATHDSHASCDQAIAALTNHTSLFQWKQQRKAAAQAAASAMKSYLTAEHSNDS
jgi:hypothetical protein